MSDSNNSDDNRKDPSGGNRGGSSQRPPQGMMPRGAVWWLMFTLALIVLVIFVTQAQNQARVVDIQTFMTYAENHSFVDSEPVLVEDNRITGLLKPNLPGSDKPAGVPDRVTTPISPQTKRLYVERLYALRSVKFKENAEPNYLLYFVFSWGPSLLIIAAIWFFIIRGFRNAGGGAGMLGNFGRSKHKVTNKEHSNVMLSDVAGIEEAKDEVFEIVEFLKNPKKFQRLGGRVPRGVLLIGDPGCGKTLLAKAVAGEADVPFFSISGSDFVEMFVGVGASRVRDLFKQAKESSPCIIFLDEIDAVGRRRGSGFSSGGHDEREQTLNAILVEMDGFETNDQVIVMAATNRSDVLDPALIRPGRFDRQIHVSLPDIKGRLEILKVHSKKIKMGPNVDLEKVARGTPMFSGADLAAIINEAAIGATLHNKDFVEQDDFEEARDKVRWGRSRKSHKMEEDERRVTAYHEAGHAVVLYFDPDAEPLHKVTIIPRGGSLGATYWLPERDRYLRTKKQLLATLRVSYGGRIAEEMFCGDISSGASGDIQAASQTARAMIMNYGMSEKLGFLLYGIDTSRNAWEQPEKMFSDDTARLIDEEVHKLIERTYAETRAMLELHRDQIERLAQALLRYETLNRDEMDRIMRGEQLSKPTVVDLLKLEPSKPKIAPKPPAPDTNIGPADPVPSPA